MEARKWKYPKELGESDWVYELGAPVKVFNPDTDMMAASTSNPEFLRKDTDVLFQWRIRNLPYPKETYSVSVDSEKQDIVLRTSNKK